MAQRGGRSGAVAAEMAGWTTFVGAFELVGLVPEPFASTESGAVSSQFQAAGHDAQAERRRAPANRNPAIPRLKHALDVA